MNAYEITCILRPDLDDEQTRALAQQVITRVETAGGEVVAHYPWSPARRRMAYPIRDFGDGFYFTATFNIESPALTEIERTLRLNDRILRFLVVQATEQMIKQSQQRMQQAEAAAKAPPTGAAPPPQAAPVVSEAAPEQAPAAGPDIAVEAAPAAASTPVDQPPVEQSALEQVPAADTASEEIPGEPVASAPAPSNTEE